MALKRSHPGWKTANLKPQLPALLKARDGGSNVRTTSQTERPKCRRTICLGKLSWRNGPQRGVCHGDCTRPFAKSGDQADTGGGNHHCASTYAMESACGAVASQFAEDCRLRPVRSGKQCLLVCGDGICR